MQAPQTHDYLFKLLLVGDAGVGKSSLILRFVDDAFTDTYIATIGYDFKLRTINVDEKKVKLQAWEKPGQERFRTIGNYYRGAHAVVILFDVANLESFNNAKRWLEDIDRYACQNVNKLLIGNGCDKATRTVTKQMAEEFAGALGITYVETSAKDGTGVENAFMTVAREIKSRIEFQNLAVQPVRSPSLAERLFSKEKLKKLEEEKTKRKEEQRNGFDDPFDSRDPFDS